MSLAAAMETLHVVCQFAASAVFLVSPPSMCVETIAFGLDSHVDVSIAGTTRLSQCEKIWRGGHCRCSILRHRAAIRSGAK